MVHSTVRALAYLVTSLAAGALGFVWTLTATIVVTLVSITQLGGPAFLGAAWLTRRLAGLERRRAGWVLGAPIASPYVPGGGRALGERVRHVVVQPATWRDLIWLGVLFPLGVAGGVAAIVTTVVEFGFITAPLWAWAVPNPHAPVPMRFLMTTVPGRLTMTGLGLVLLPVAAWLVRTLGRLQARAAHALLAPGLHTHLVDQTTRLAESRRRVVDAQAAELRRIERDLHDGAQARIVAAGMTLALASRHLRQGMPEPDGPTARVAADIDLARRQLDDALAELRRLVRGIHPPILADLGLSAALTALAGDSPLTVTIHGDADARWPAAVESAAYFVVAEALANSAKHADASRCDVTIGQTEDAIHVILTDDGHGGADPAGSGLHGLRRRVEALDGTLAVTSPPGGPTTVHAEFPCAS